MAVFRIEKVKDYTIMTNHHLRNKALSLKAKGLQSLMLSLPENWDFTLAGLAYICQDGISSVRSGIAELEDHGYLTRQRLRETNGQLGDIEYTIHEVPCKTSVETVDNFCDVIKNTPPVCEKPISQKPICENQTLDNPIFEDSTQLNTKTNQISKELITDLSNIDLSIGDADKSNKNVTIDSMEIYRQIIKENIEYNNLVGVHNYSTDEIGEILELMVETVCSKGKTVRINGEDKPVEVVKSQFLKLDQYHIEYVLECLNTNTTEVRNIKSYLLTTLYNAPLTIGNYYKSRVKS